MRLNLDKPEETVFTRNRKGVRFLPLGLEKADDLSRAAKNKIRHARRGSVDAVWGTIGMADNSPPIWKGAIHFSRAGSRSSTPRRSGNATMEEIGHVYEGRSEAVNADRDRAKVLERFISFEDLTFADLQILQLDKPENQVDLAMTYARLTFHSLHPQRQNSYRS